MSELMIRGAGGGKSGGGGGGISEEPDTLSSVAQARFSDLLCEGPIEGLINNEFSIYLDGVPLKALSGTPNYRPFRWDFRRGLQSQTVIPGFAGTQSEIAVGVRLTKAQGEIVRDVSDADADSVRVTVAVNGLTQTATDGKIGGTTVDYVIRVRRVGGAWVSHPKQIKGKATSRYQRSYEIELRTLGAGPYEVAVERITDDSTSGLLVNDLFWDSFTVINYEQFTYPNSALAAVEIDARYFGQVPSRSYHIRALLVRVPTNYDPIARTYATTGPGTTNGAWDGSFKIAWTNNPAWCFYDMLLSRRYGLGRRITADQIDKWSVFEIAKYCDGAVPTGNFFNVFEVEAGSSVQSGGNVVSAVPSLFGNLEPRFTLNCVINTQEDAYRVLNQLASVFRGMAYWSSNSMMLTQDRPASSAYLFTNANVIDGLFNYQGSSRAQRHTVALVGWNDPAEDFKQKFVYVEDREGIARYGVRTTEIVAFGTTSKSQARRVGLWYLYTQRLEKDAITFRTGLDGAKRVPGEIVEIADNDAAGVRWGGRVLSSTDLTVTLDSNVRLSIGVYTLSVMARDGTVTKKTVNAAIDLDTNTLTVSTAFVRAPAAMAVWTLASTSVIPRLARVISVKQDSPTVYELSVVDHNPSKYEAIERGVAAERFDYSFLDYNDVRPIEGLRVTENSFKRTVQSPVQSNIEVGWTLMQDPLIRGYICKLDGSDGTSRVLPEQSEASVTFENVLPITYTVRVQAVNHLGIKGEFVGADIVVTGRDTTPPADVDEARLGYTTDRRLGLRLTWVEVADFIDFYEVREGSQWESAVSIGTIKGNNFLIGPVGSGNRTYLVKAVDTAGNPSRNAASIIISIAVTAAPVVSYHLSGPDESIVWTIPAGPFAIDRYEIRVGPQWEGASFLDTIKSTGKSRKVDYLGARRYWVAAIDVAGSYGTPGFVDVVIVAPGPVVGGRAEIIDNNVLLYWAEPLTGSLPIDRYEVRKGTSFAAGQIVGSNGNSTFTAIFEQQSGVYQYWIGAFDSAGNPGTPVDIVATINQPPDYILRTNINSTFVGTKTNIYIEQGKLIGPVDTTQTWSSHFINNEFDTPQEQIDFGFPLYAMPSTTGGSYEEIFDYGTTLPATTIVVTPGIELLAGNVTTEVQISYKANLGDAWTDADPGATSALASNFRYIKVLLNFSCTAGANLIRVNQLNVKLSTKLKTDSGAGTITNANNGIVVSFNVPFIDADTPLVQPAGTTPLIAVVDFSDTPNPAGFTVFLYTLAGAKTTGSFSWTARGY